MPSDPNSHEEIPKSTTRVSTNDKKPEKVDVDIRVNSYAPKVFRFIRAIDGVNEIDIMKSVKPEMNKMQLFKSKMSQNHGSGGKSGSFFFFTEDKNFIIKTMTKNEKKTLIQMLPNMIEFLIKTGGKSIISRIYGLYKVQYSGMSPLFLTVQRNNIQIGEDNKLMSTFDLKGSKYSRNELKPDDYKYLFRNENHD